MPPRIINHRMKHDDRNNGYKKRNNKNAALLLREVKLQWIAYYGPYNKKNAGYKKYCVQDGGGNAYPNKNVMPRQLSSANHISHIQNVTFPRVMLHLV